MQTATFNVRPRRGNTRQSTGLLLRLCPLTRVPDTLYFASTVSHESEARTEEGYNIVKRRLAAAAGAALLLLLAVQPASPTPAQAHGPQPSQWEKYRTPTHEDLLILPGSDIISFDIAGSSGKTIYAIGAWNAPSSCIENSYSDDNISAGQAPRLWKSADGGVTWRDRSDRVLDAVGLPDCNDDSVSWNDFVFFSAVAAAPDDDDFVIICGYDALHQPLVVGSNDGAEEFRYTGCGELRGEILCADVSPETDGGRSIAVGTLDPVSGGSVWRLEPGAAWAPRWEDSGDYPGWADAWSGSGGAGTRMDIYAVTSVAFSPAYKDDRAVMAVLLAYAEEQDGDPYTGYYVATGDWDSESWNVPAEFDGFPVAVTSNNSVIHSDASIPAFFLRHITDLALPDDYRADKPDRRVLLLAVNGIEVNPADGSTVDEGGFIFWLNNSSISRELLNHEQNPWVTSIAYHGSCDMDGPALAGCFLPEALASEWRWSPEIDDWFNDDGDHADGENVLPCCASVFVLISDSLEECCPDWEAAEQPPSGQFNAQVAFTPDGSRAYATTEGDSRHGLDEYRWGDESAFSVSDTSTTGDHWEQTGLIDTMIHEIQGVNYDPVTGCLYLQTGNLESDDQVCDCDSIWRSCDGGDSYTRMLFGRPDEDDSVEDAFEGVMDKYHRGFFVPRTEGSLQTAGVRYIIGDAIDEDDDEQVEADFEADAVYRLFEDEGGEWKRISELILNYEGLLVMECDGSEGSVLYVGFDNLWWDYTANQPLPYQSDGSDPVCPWGHDCRKVSGVARCLDPGAPGCCEPLEWDYLIRGLQGTADTDGVYEQLLLSGAHCGEGAIRLWAFDDGNRYWSTAGEESDNYDWCAREFINADWGRLWTYDDCFAVSALTPGPDEETPIVPSDPCVCVNEEFVLEWERPCDGCEYEIEIALGEDFRHVVLDTADFVDRPTAGEGRRFYRPPQPAHPSLLVEQGMLDCSRTYWWRVRGHMAETDEVISTWWSEPQSFRIAPSAVEALTLGAPGDGVTMVPVSNIAFTWSSVSDVTSYDFMLVDSERGHVASQVGTFTSFVLPGPLDYDTPYVWRVLALDGERIISESLRSTFRTQPQPSPPPDTSAQPTIIPPQQPGIPEWAPLFVGIIGVLLLGTLGALSYVNRMQRREHDNSAD